MAGTQRGLICICFGSSSSAVCWVGTISRPTFLLPGVESTFLRGVSGGRGSPFHKIDVSLLKIHRWPTLNMAKCRCKWGAGEADLFIANKSEFEARPHKYHKLSGIVFYGSWWKLFHLFISSKRDKVKKVTTTRICKADILPFPIKRGHWHS